ncbi:MAG: hypothetical protein H6581_01855 [Bacteroidia bacterium]|nr:hypothetical protein [Bacteroidia bacterium]
MKHTLILITILVLAASLRVEAQVPRFSKQPIGESGCKAYLPGTFSDFEVSKTEDGLPMYMGEYVENEITYGVILVDLSKGEFAEESKEDLLTLLTSYLDYLQSAFEITGAAGYGLGHTLDSNPNAQGVIDYWEDGDLLQYAVKGWVDHNALAVLFVSGKELPVYNVQEMFLNGFRFKEN